jgi:hypothetical protein
LSQDDVTQIEIGNSPVGVIGLKTVLEGMLISMGRDRIREKLKRYGKNCFQ